MRFYFKCVIFLAFAVMPFLSARGSISPTSSLLKILVDKRGKCSMEAHVALSSNLIGNAIQSGNFILFTASVPLPTRENADIISAPDIKVAFLSTGSKDTTFVILCQSSLKHVFFEIHDCIQLSETHAGKAKLTFDVTYPLITQGNRALMAHSSNVNLWDIEIVLPREYSDTDISFRPLIFERIDKYRFKIEHSKLTSSISEIWFAFPNPSLYGYKIAQISVSLLIGCFTCLFHVYALRGRKTLWLLLVFLCSGTILGLSSYYYLSLAKRLDFMVFSAVALPHAIVGFLGSIYVLLSKRYQAFVSGLVLLDDRPIDFSEVKILAKNPRGEVKVLKQQNLLKDSKYRFFVWARALGREVQVVAKTGSSEQESVEWTKVFPGKTYELTTIELHRLVEVDKGPGGN